MGSEYKNVNGSKVKLALPIGLLLFGVLIRFYYQFVEWSFNGDEVDLGLEIINHSFKNILYPFKSRQSAPPLFLLAEKLISETGRPYISLKIITFFSSCASLFLFNRILKNYLPFYLQLMLLAIFCFNPFIIGNSLTLKQYSLDLMLGLVAVNYFLSIRNAFKIFFFFSIFCLLSNVGLFFCASFSFFLFFQIVSEKKGFFFSEGLKLISPYLLAPLPYLLFFIWFLKQPGAEIMKNYMVGYWSGAFMPTDLSIFKWLAIQAKVLTLFFFSTYWLIGFPIFLLFLLSLFFIVKLRKYIYQNRLRIIILIYILTALVHLILSVIKLYPFSDRLFLYLAPGIYLILGSGIMQLYKESRTGFFWKKVFYSSLVILVFMIFLYFSYLPRRENDVASLLKFVNSKDQTFAFTPKAKQTCMRWLEFTQYYSDSNRHFKPVEFHLNMKSQADFLIAIQSGKFGHTEKMTTPEPIIQELIAQDKILLYHRVGGYVIYKILRSQ